MSMLDVRLKKNGLKDCIAILSLFSFSPDIFLFSLREKKKAVRIKNVLIGGG